MNVQRTTQRIRTINEKVTVTGVGTTQYYDIQVPDGMILELAGVQVTHDKASAALIGTSITDNSDVTTQSYWVASVTVGLFMIAPDRADTTQNGYMHRPHGEPLLVPSGHHLRIHCGNVDDQHYTYIYLNYRLKPYTFNRDNTPPT